MELATAYVLVHVCAASQPIVRCYFNVEVTVGSRLQALLLCYYNVEIRLRSSLRALWMLVYIYTHVYIMYMCIQ